VRWVASVWLACACGRYGFEQRSDALAGVDDGASDTTDTLPACGFVLGAGRQHLSAVFPDGTARVWGDGAYGQIGDSFMQDRATPTTVTLPGRAVSVSAGRFETCAALESGEAYCWGEGDSGQLGDGNGVTSSNPVKVATITNVVELAAAALHVCARTGDGSVYCWGDGTAGRLGTGNMNPSLTPVQTLNISTATRLVAGGSVNCAILADGSPRCWGENMNGGIGNNSTADATTPTQPIGLATVRAVTARDYSACVVRGDGNVFCFGENNEGQCGTTPVGTDQLVPVQVVKSGSVPLTEALDVGLGIEHACALLADHTVWCWGRNQYGQLGTGGTSMTPQPFATQVPGLPDIVHIGVAAWTSCGLARDGVVWCWGYGPDGELGDGTFTAMQPTPKAVFTACP